MSAALVLAVVSLGAAVVLASVVLRVQRRLAWLEHRAVQLEQLVRGELEPGLVAARQDARAAASSARDAAIAAGARPPTPRLPLEPVTGPVVRAVAFGASARRVIARVATPSWSRRRGLPRSA